MKSVDELPAPAATLFPDRQTRERLDDLLTRELASMNERVHRGPVMPAVEMSRFRQELAAFDFAAPQPLQKLLTWAILQLEHGLVHTNNPRYFGLFNPAANFPSQAADRIAGAFNPQLASSGSSPVAVEIEAHMIQAVAKRAGMPPDCSGHFTVGGSEGNFTSLICALTRANSRFGSDGIRAFSGPVAMYTSRACQPAWFKIAHQAGVGREGLKLVATDGKGRMDTEALATAIRRDLKEGIVPVLISSTAGTTGAGMIDPLAECATIAKDHGIWHHVDAAWGGAALCSDRLKGLLAGIELADSVTIDAHKWLATTMGCGLFIARHPAVLSESFRVTADFMPSSVANLDPYLNSAQWSRRFMGLRLFLALGAAGWQGYAAHVERAAAVVASVKQRLVARGWTAVNDSELAVLCVAAPAGFPEARDIVKRVLASSRAWVALGNFEGQDVVRICATHGESALTDVDELVRALESTRSA
jgi:glutamate/tyrosine decarboxylase-like PLP-dependent enzyme